ncbi:MAG: SDR family NAD(P)-dependent oxidoreductase, partial [Bacteroidota bacterium]
TNMNIIITGGHSGIGLELSRKLLAEGHQIGLIVRSEKRKAETEKLFSEKDKVNIFIADLSKRDQITQVVNEIQSHWELIDGIFNNAGVLLDKLYISDYGNELQLEINALSPYLLTKALIPLLEKAKSPFVLNTATGELNKKKTINIPELKRPKKFVKLLGSYWDSKLIMLLLMNQLSQEFKQIRFVHVNPGAIKTKMTSGSGMPFWLRPIRNLLFKSPTYGAEKLYEGAFSKELSGTGIYVSGGKIKPIHQTLSKEEITELLSDS